MDALTLKHSDSQLLEFEEYSDYIEYTTGPDRKVQEDRNLEKESSFHGPPWSKAAKQLKGGYEGSHLIDINLDFDLAELEETTYHRGHSGEFFDVGLVASGEPDVWFGSSYEYVKPTVTMYIGTSFYAGVSVDAVIKRGQGIMNIVNKLNTLVNLDIKFFICDEITSTRYGVVVIPAPKPYDVDAISFMVTTPQSFRRIGWNAIYRLTGKIASQCRAVSIKKACEIDKNQNIILFDTITDNETDYIAQAEREIKKYKDKYEESFTI